MGKTLEKKSSMSKKHLRIKKITINYLYNSCQNNFIVAYPNFHYKLSNCYRPTTMSVNSKPFFTAFLYTWLGRFTKPT